SAVGSTGSRNLALATPVLIGMYRGEYDRSAARLGPVISPRTTIPRIDNLDARELLRARLALATGDLVQAEREIVPLYEILIRVPDIMTTVPQKIRGFVLMIELRLRQDRLSDAERHLGELEQLTQALAEKWSSSTLAHARGMIEARRGNLTAAAKHFLESAKGWKELGYPYESAVSLYELGVTSQSADDPASAAAAFNEALEIFQRLEARPYVDRILAAKAARVS
ncbi:MAG: tetratricopeptide repeat protein, partial [Thermoplasmata archaeon]